MVVSPRKISQLHFHLSPLITAKNCRFSEEKKLAKSTLTVNRLSNDPFWSIRVREELGTQYFPMRGLISDSRTQY